MRVRARNQARPARARCRPIEVRLKPGGYRGRWPVIIRQNDNDEFEAVGSMNDPTRFPQRIRVAARALHLEGAYGRFGISHDPDPVSSRSGEVGGIRRAAPRASS